MERQTHLDGVLPDEIPEVTEAQNNYHDTMTERIEWSSKESKAHDALLALLDKHNLKAYRGPVYETVINQKRKAQTKKIGTEEKNSAKG